MSYDLIRKTICCGVYLNISVWELLHMCHTASVKENYKVSDRLESRKIDIIGQL